jgi:hypothetical protein
MNIHFSELDNNIEEQNFEQQNFGQQNFGQQNFGQQNFENNESQLNNPEKYWDNYQQQVPQPKKKKVSFDDILSNMNLVVNQKGVLQFMQPMQNDEYMEQTQYQQPYQEYVAQQQQQQQQQQQLDPSLKHSFLYNKYFKDYKDATTYEPEIRVPKTMEEYRQMLIDDKIKQIQQKKRIEEIKSTKLMFTTNVTNQSNTIRPTINNLRSMNFH